MDGCEQVEGGKCTKCSEKYEKKGEECKMAHCLVGKGGRCEVCEEGYNYVDGSCSDSQPKLVFNPY